VIQNKSNPDLSYNPLHRESKISKFIVPSMSSVDDKKKGFRGRFDDDKTISANMHSIGDPNRKSRTDRLSANMKKNSSFSKNDSSPFKNIFKK
jgi:hypothetical protein